METSADRVARLSRTMDDINQIEMEELARGSGPRPTADHQLHLNMLRRRIQQQRSIVSKLTRDDLENQHLHVLEELEILKKEGNSKDQYIKKLSTKLLRLQRTESRNREDVRAFSGSLRTELEQKIRNLENQLRMTKVYGSTLPARRGSVKQSDSSLNKTATEPMRQKLQAVETERKEEQERSETIIRELQDELERSREKMTVDNARSTMLENIEITRLTRQLSKTVQDLLNMKNEYAEMRSKYEELQINKVVISRENERLKSDIERYQQTVDASERQLRESREKALQQLQDQERVSRLESSFDMLKRQQLELIRSESPLDPNMRVAETVLRTQIKNLEDELAHEANDSHELRKRITDREMDIEKALRELSELRSTNLHLKYECDDMKAKLEVAVRAEPKESDGWFRAPPGLLRENVSDAFRLLEAFCSRRSMGTSTEMRSDLPSEIPTEVKYHMEELQLEIMRMKDDLLFANDELKRAREVVVEQNQKISGVQQTSNDASEELRNLQRKLEEKNRQIANNTKLIRSLEKQLKDIAEGTLVYNLEEEIADQSRLSADNVILQHGDNLLQLHFGPFIFSEEFFAQAEALRITKWRLKWSVFGENMFAQDSDKKSPDFDFTAIHCITMDEQIMTDIAEAFIRVELVGCRDDYSRAFALATFSCRKLLEDSYQGLNRIRGEAPLISQFDIGTEFGLMAYWIRIKFDIKQTEAMFRARQKALNFVESNDEWKIQQPSSHQLWMAESESGANLLHIRIHDCRNVKALVGTGPPSPCVLYQFYNSRTTYTPTVTASENPDFTHDNTVRLIVNENLHGYLLSEKLDVYVTDTRDHNKDHFLGYCRVNLTELIARPICDLRLDLLTKDNRLNGSIRISLSWEHPYLIPGKEPSHQIIPHQRPSNGGRVPRSRLTPRGSLVSVSHTSQLVKVRTPTGRNNPSSGRILPNPPEAQSADGVENHIGDVRRPKPPPRRSITNRHEFGDHQDTKGDLTLLDSQKGNDYFSPPPTSNNGKNTRKPELQPRRPFEDQQLQKPIRRASEQIELHDIATVQDGFNRSAFARELADTETCVRSSSPSPRSDRRQYHSLERSERKSHRESDEAIRNVENQHRTLSLRDRLTGSNKAEKTRKSTAERAATRNGTVKTITADLHSDPHRVEMDQRNGPTAPPRRGRDSVLSVRQPPTETIVVIIHSLYFIDGAEIISDERPGEIFVVFDFLRSEHESPLAVVKPAVANKELTFEFQKVFPVDAKEHGRNRKLVEEMLSVVPSGRIQFSVYFQPDDENQDSELVAVAALSLNRLLVKSQDALGAELKLVSSTGRGLAVGYIKVTVQAIGVLLEIKDELERR